MTGALFTGCSNWCKNQWIASRRTDQVLDRAYHPIPQCYERNLNWQPAWSLRRFPRWRICKKKLLSIRQALIFRLYLLVAFPEQKFLILSRRNAMCQQLRPGQRQQRPCQPTTAGLMISIWSRKALKLGFLHPVRLKIKIIIIIIE